MSDIGKILLEAQDLHVNYGAINALSGFSMKLMEREIVAVIGANGAGKSTFMNAVMGMVKLAKGTILLEGRPLPGRDYRVVRSGLALVPEGRRIFAPLTVEENLRVGPSRGGTRRSGTSTGCSPCSPA